jgi:hypothetical protein
MPAEAGAGPIDPLAWRWAARPRRASPHDDTENPIDTSHASSILRPLGAFEHIIDLYISRNPVQFSLAIELASSVPPGRLTQALAELQAAHPLLAARIDRGGERPAFHRADATIPVRHVEGGDWRTEAATEQTRPIDPAGSPLARATLLTDDGGKHGSVVLLTFSHQIADGRGALRAARDLLALLAGRTLHPRPVPDAQEDLLHRLPSAAAPSVDDGSAEQPVPEPGTLRPFDAAAPGIEIAELDQLTTERLRTTAREHDSTVQGALCAAGALELLERPGAEQVRINVPIDLRSSGLDDDLVNRFVATTVTFRASADDGLWSRARDATAQLRFARDHAREAVAMLASLHPRDAAEAEAAMLAATSADLEITNLGVSGEDTSTAAAIWGPTMTTQVDDERILGVLTHGGRLRLALTTHGRPDGLTTGIARRLAAAV